jgi:hypothetical protein
MRLDSRARTSARSRRGISKGFPTLAINAVTAHHAADEILESGRGSASFPSQHVLFALPTPPPELRRFAYCDSARRKVVVLHIGSDRNESGAAAQRRCIIVFPFCCSALAFVVLRIKVAINPKQISIRDKTTLLYKVTIIAMSPTIALGQP